MRLKMRMKTDAMLRNCLWQREEGSIQDSSWRLSRKLLLLEPLRAASSYVLRVTCQKCMFTGLANNGKYFSPET